MKIVTAGRTDFENYFAKSGIREYKKLNHNPFIVFNYQASTNTLLMDIVDSCEKLLSYADEVQVMAQWAGQWRSDFMKFTVGDLRKYISNNPRAI